jgi:hypothetical protein
VLELELEYRHGGASDAVLHANRVMGAGHIRQQKSGWRGDSPAAAHPRSSMREAYRSYSCDDVRCAPGIAHTHGLIFDSEFFVGSEGGTAAGKSFPSRSVLR